VVANLFLSHAVADRHLVDALIKLLEGGIGLAPDQIFCTSFDEQGIPAGRDFSAYMREELVKKAETVLALVTPQYYESAFSLCETGAAWASDKQFIPLLVPPINYHDLRGALYGKQGMLIDDPQKLDALRDELKHLIREETSTTRWNRRRDEFLKELPSLLAAMKPLGSIPAAEADKLRKERDRYQQESVALDERVERLQEQVAALEKARSAEDVRAIHRDFSDEGDNFEEVLGTARNALVDLPRVVMTALFYDRRGEPFYPEYDEWQNAPRQAVEQNLLRQSEGKFWPKEGHPKISRAIDALSELERFVSGVSPEFRHDYEDEHDDLLDVHSQTFWDRHNLF
jgi:TIR domain